MEHHAEMQRLELAYEIGEIKTCLQELKAALENHTTIQGAHYINNVSEPPPDEGGAEGGENSEDVELVMSQSACSRAKDSDYGDY